MDNPLFVEFLARIRHHESLKSFTRSLKTRQINRLLKALQAELDRRDAVKTKDKLHKQMQKTAAERLLSESESICLKETFTQLSKRYK